MRKFDTFDKYPRGCVTATEMALLTIWPSLRRYEDDIVLVGGLAVHYLTRQSTAGLPGTVTMDVDFGITLGASSGQYGTIRSDLAGLGFTTINDQLVRMRDGFALYIDFLTEDTSSLMGTRMVDDVVASVVPGINRALATPQFLDITGVDCYGANQCCKVAVADIGPLLVLKLNAFGGPTGRRLPKDAYDILLLVMGYKDGPQKAISGFQEEARMQNPGLASAIATIEADFCDPNSDGALRAAEFYPTSDEDRDRIREQVVTVGRALLRAVRP